MSKKTDFERRDRLSELLKGILAETLNRLDDPSLELLSISEVEVDNNLNRAKVYVTSLEINQWRETGVIEALEKNMNSFMHDLADKARLRQLPELSFHIDEKMRASAKVDEILRELDFIQKDKP